MIRRAIDVVADMPTTSGSMRSTWKRDAEIVTNDRLAVVARLREMAVEIAEKSYKAIDANDLQNALYIAPGLLRAADQLEREIKEAGT